MMRIWSLDIPHLFFDREGVIKSIYIGELTQVEMEKHVKAIVK